MAAKPSGADFDGAEIIPEVNLEPGMNFDLWARDRAGFRTSMRMVTGGITCHLGDYSGIEVGPMYQSGMAEERVDITYVQSNPVFHFPDPTGRIPLQGPTNPGEFQKESATQFGKNTLRAPQNYREYHK